MPAPAQLTHAFGECTAAGGRQDGARSTAKRGFWLYCLSDEESAQSTAGMWIACALLLIAAVCLLRRCGWDARPGPPASSQIQRTSWPQACEVAVNEYDGEMTDRESEYQQALTAWKQLQEQMEVGQGTHRPQSCIGVHVQ
jgi:hypothetical protein